MFSHQSRPLSTYFLMIGRYAPQIEPYVTLPPVTYAVSGATVGPDHRERRVDYVVAVPRDAGVSDGDPTERRMHTVGRAIPVFPVPLQNLARRSRLHRAGGARRRENRSGRGWRRGGRAGRRRRQGTAADSPPLVVVAGRLARPELHDRAVGVQLPLLAGPAGAGPDDQLRTAGGAPTRGVETLGHPTDGHSQLAGGRRRPGPVRPTGTRPDHHLRTIGAATATHGQALTGHRVDQRAGRDGRIGTGYQHHGRDSRHHRGTGRRESVTKSDPHEVSTGHREGCAGLRSLSIRVLLSTVLTI